MYLDESYDNDIVKMVGALSRIKAIAESALKEESADEALSHIIDECDYAVYKEEDGITEARRILDEEEDCCS